MPSSFLPFVSIRSRGGCGTGIRSPRPCLTSSSVSERHRIPLRRVQSRCSTPTLFGLFLCSRACQASEDSLPLLRIVLIDPGGYLPMPESLARPLGTIRVGEKGEITVPAAYRKRHKLSKGSEVLLLQLGEALMMIPADPLLNRLCQKIQDILTGQGISIKQALKNLEKVRQRRFQELYGEG